MGFKTIVGILILVGASTSLFQILYDIYLNFVIKRGKGGSNEMAELIAKQSVTIDSAKAEQERADKEYEDAKNSDPDTRGK